MSRDEGVDATGVSGEQAREVRREVVEAPLGDFAEAERAVFPVVRERAPAENLREFAFREAPAQVHLPKAVLRCHIALSKVGVLDRLGADVRHAPRVS